MNGGEHAATGFREYHGLRLRRAGHRFGTGLEVLHPLACTAIGISYLAVRGQESVVVREIVPEIDVSDFTGAHRLSRSLLPWQIEIEDGLLCRPFVPGQSLEQYLLVEGAMSADTARAHVVRLVQDLRDLHRAGMMHGSLHGGNIILSEEREATLVDAVAPASLRQRAIRVLRGEIYDDRTHLAPELLRGRPLRPAADWYSLGSLIWLALTGLPRYHVGETNSKKVAGAPPDAPLSCPREQAWFRRLIEALLEPDPERRLSDADIILEALDRERFRAPRKRIAVAGNAKDISRGAPAADTAPAVDSGSRSRYRTGTGARWSIAALGTLCSLLAGFLLLAVVRIAGLERDLDRLRDDLTHLQARPHSEPEEFGKTEQSFDSRAADAESLASDLRRELDAQRILNRHLEKKLEAQTNELKTFQNQSEELVESAVNKSEADRHRANTFKQSLDNSEAQLATARTESAQLEREREAVIRSRNEKIKDLRRQLQNMRTEREELEKKHSDAIWRKDDEISQLHESEKELLRVRARRDEAHADALKEKEKTIEQLHQQLKELETVKKKEVIDRLEKRVKELEKENRQLNEKPQVPENGGPSQE